MIAFESGTRLLYQQDALPIFQNRMYESEAAARSCPTGDIRLVEDLRSGLVYNAAFRPELLVYDHNYQNEQGLSPRFQQHLESVAAIIARDIGRRSLIEVGCGKGHFLETLRASGFDVVGFDPAYEGSSPRVHRALFSEGVVPPAGGIILRHVLEHIQDPVRFLGELRSANGGSGRIYIEVPCMDWICERRAWFDVFYEHVNYFRASDFHRMFGTVISSTRLFGGQYLGIVADLGTLCTPVADPAAAVRFPSDFTRSIDASGEGDCIWGGASKGVTFALVRQRAGRPIRTVIDISPGKQGKFLPATGLLVQSPADALPRLSAGATIIVMNSNYLEEIAAASNHAFRLVALDDA